MEEPVVGSMGLSGLRENRVTREASWISFLTFISAGRPAHSCALAG